VPKCVSNPSLSSPLTRPPFRVWHQYVDANSVTRARPTTSVKSRARRERCEVCFQHIDSPATSGVGERPVGCPCSHRAPRPNDRHRGAAERPDRSRHRSTDAPFDDDVRARHVYRTPHVVVVDSNPNPVAPVTPPPSCLHDAEVPAWIRSDIRSGDLPMGRGELHAALCSTSCARPPQSDPRLPPVDRPSN